MKHIVVYFLVLENQELPLAIFTNLPGGHCIENYICNKHSGRVQRSSTKLSGTGNDDDDLALSSLKSMYMPAIKLFRDLSKCLPAQCWESSCKYTCSRVIVCTVQECRRFVIKRYYDLVSNRCKL